MRVARFRLRGKAVVGGLGRGVSVEIDIVDDSPSLSRGS